MLSDFTLFIPTYNRPKYLERILKYYQFSGVKILVADSSVTPYEVSNDFPDVQYLHLPDKMLPQKTAIALKHISTKYMAICADDDFTVPDGIEACINFLEKNKDFVAAQGNTLSYKKNKVSEGKLSFSVLYKNTLSFSIDQEGAFDRAQRLFHPYRTIFTAVHYTKNLQLAYNESIDVKNLFLNEYLSGVVPILKGKYVELPLFFQVREYTADSGDKVTDNIDVIIHSEKYREEFDKYLGYIAATIAKENIGQQENAVVKLKKIFAGFADTIKKEQRKKQRSFGEKITGGILRLPATTIRGIAKLKRGAVINLVIKTSQDKKNLEKISGFINAYASQLDA